MGVQFPDARERCRGDSPHSCEPAQRQVMQGKRKVRAQVAKANAALRHRPRCGDGTKKPGKKSSPVFFKNLFLSIMQRTYKKLEIEFDAGCQYQAVKITEDVFHLSKRQEIIPYVKICSSAQVKTYFTRT